MRKIKKLFKILFWFALIGIGIYYGISAWNTHNALHKEEIKTDTIIQTKVDTLLLKPQVNLNADTVFLKKDNDGLFTLKVFVDGVPMKFALDTGCSDMSMSIIEYIFLEHQGLIKDNTNRDCISELANGETEKGFTTTLDSIRIGKKVAKNVTCTISMSEDASLLIGQEALSKFGDVTIKHSKGLLIFE